MPSLSIPFKRFIAQQLSHPAGIFGKLVMGRWLNTMNERQNQQVLHAMDLSPHDRVLEVGFGGGGLLELIVKQVVDGSIDGIDISDEMVLNARSRFRADIEAGRLRLHLENAGSLPFPDGNFDAVCAVNTVYFWKDLAPVFEEFSRVIRPEGRLVLGFTTPEFIRRAGFDQLGFTPYSAEELSAALTAHGFSSGAFRSEKHVGGPSCTLTAIRREDKPAFDAAAVETLKSLEQQVNSEAVRHDRMHLDALIDEEFREFGSSGTSYTKQGAIDALLATAPQPITMDEFSVKQLSGSVFLTTYRALTSGSVSLRSSLWIRNGQSWKLIFHQGTNVAP